MSSLLILFLLRFEATGSFENFTFSHKDSLEVVAVAADGEHLPGVTLALCPYGSDGVIQAEISTHCSQAITNQEGFVRFTSVAPGVYSLTGQLTGFASSAIYPLSIRGGDPIAPDRVFMLLNPVCFDC